MNLILLAHLCVIDLNPTLKVTEISGLRKENGKINWWMSSSIFDYNSSNHQSFLFKPMAELDSRNIQFFTQKRLIGAYSQGIIAVVLIQGKDYYFWYFNWLSRKTKFSPRICLRICHSNRPWKFVDTVNSSVVQSILLVMSN